MTGNSAGFDFGLKTFLTASNGKQIESPLYYREAMAELKLAQQNLGPQSKVVWWLAESQGDCDPHLSTGGQQTP